MGIKPGSPEFQADSLPSEPPGKPNSVQRKYTTGAGNPALPRDSEAWGWHRGRGEGQKSWDLETGFLSWFPLPPGGRVIMENSTFHSLCLLIPENSVSFRRSAHFTVTSWESLLSLSIWHFAVSNFQCQGTVSTCCVNNLLEQLWKNLSQ